ncbi:MAG: Holliday junction resolvase RuvX [Bifidobacterium sp.]|jgi:putative Holliday junction resolvase|nr:Holliday junction resolvase RuvX [Bifidobacterium sp.]MCI1865265.1 Holliday junction resolvase RuvX [Bifidobacterium sp.]
MTWLGVDLGEARVGISLSDPELTLAHPVGNIDVWGDSFRAIDEVVEIAVTNEVSCIVVGLPLMLDGSEGKSARKARRWARNLTKRLAAPPESAAIRPDRVPDVVLVDERLTTVTAHRQLFQAQIRSRGHRPLVDQQSAVMILQSALNRHNHAGAMDA